MKKTRNVDHVGNCKKLMVIVSDISDQLQDEQREEAETLEDLKRKNRQHDVVGGKCADLSAGTGHCRRCGSRPVTCQQRNARRAVQEAQVDLLKFFSESGRITGLISTINDLDQSVGMLYNAPQAVVLVEALAILALDPSLVSEKMPRGEFIRLKTPSSFKASLYQVASLTCNSFRTADVSMMTIEAKLAD